MKKLDLDLAHLNGVVNPNRGRVPVKGNEHRFVRVAFDMFRLKDNDNSEDLWQIQADDDGNEFLVRTYDDLKEDGQQITASDWSVTLDKAAKNLTVAFCNVPIQRLAASNFGAEKENDVLMLRDLVSNKLSTDKNFVDSFLKTLPKEKLEILAEMGAIDPATKARPVPPPVPMEESPFDDEEENIDEFLAGLSEGELEDLQKKLNEIFGGKDVMTSAPAEEDL